MSIYQNVKSACVERKMTINALESKLGFPRGSIFKWDKHMPAVDKVKAVAEVLDKPIEYFLEE